MTVERRARMEAHTLHQNMHAMAATAYLSTAVTYSPKMLLPLTLEWSTLCCLTCARLDCKSLPLTDTLGYQCEVLINKFCSIGPWAKCYTTFYIWNLRVLMLCSSFVPGKPFQPSLIFEGKARAYQNEAPFKCSTLGQAPCLTHKHWIRL